MRQVSTRLRGALVRGVTAVTTGTAVLLFSSPATAVAEPGPGPGQGAGSGSGSGAGSGAGAGAGAGVGGERRDQPPTCGKASDPDFPIDTRIHGGPADYRPGDAFRTWNVDLTNTTRETCDSIHPVLALTDRDRVLRPAQIRLDFYDAEARRWRPVAFEETEEDENVGVFDDGFPGFAVPAGRTLTVPVRLAFRDGTAPNEVVANAAVVQRRGADGDWVGESDDYRLTIGPAPATPPAVPPPGRSDDGVTGNGVRPVTPPRRPVPELAQTGPAARRAAGAMAGVAGAAVVIGAGLVALGRRRRRGNGG